MQQAIRFAHARKFGLIAAILLTFLIFFSSRFYVRSQDKSAFPDGYDAMQSAPGSHKVIFENEFVRILEVTVPPSGSTIPMHHHRWPSFFLSWDTGGKSPHIRYHRADGSVSDQPSVNDPIHPGSWSIGWMKPEPMHSIEVVDNPESPSSKGPSDLRIEIKCHP